MKHTNVIKHEHPLSVLDRFLDIGLRGLGEYEPQVPAKKNDLACGSFEVFEEEGQYVATLDLPGVKKKDIELHVEGRGLQLRAAREARGKSSQESQSVEHALTLGENIDPEKIHAKLEDGVLEITLPKADATKTRKIAVM